MPQKVIKKVFDFCKEQAFRPLYNPIDLLFCRYVDLTFDQQAFKAELAKI